MSRPENLPLLSEVALSQVPGIMLWTSEEVMTLFTAYPLINEEASPER